ncbi:hydrogenase nickel incorporation protein HypB [Myxococcota bacterium]|nr:hydrogenase nickel incorporation protein HypB [Myxococcota bacterium]
MHDININADILAGNEEAAHHNREHFIEHGVYVFNLMSAPGAGKTTLLERTVQDLGKKYKIAVIEGDVQTDQDAKRIEKHGVQAIQINTGGACHLDARMVHKRLHEINLDELDILIIENVGNLVCPAEFDLGEHDKVMVLSTAEGDDKPRKYPVMFHEARAMLINKIDLLPYVDFDVAKASREARGFNIDLDVLELSARSGEGMDKWYEWLEGRIQKMKRA